jgi:hypothetical protein
MADHSYGASDLKFLENAAKEARHRIDSWLRKRRPARPYTSSIAAVWSAKLR